MNITIAIVGLAILILLHEAGHFVVARAVGMRPRKFYLGFGPALAKVRRNGIEYGIGAIPLGGYVKIPGMHRPAPSDLDVHLGSALHEQPELVRSVGAVKRLLEAGDFAGARVAVPELEAAVDAAELSPGASRSARRGVNDLRDGLGADAYWRQRTWKRIVVIFAGPGMNILIALLLPVIAYTIGAPGDTTRVVKAVSPGTPAAHIGLRPGDEVVGVNGKPTPTFDAVSSRIRGSNGRRVQVTVLRQGRVVALRPARTKRIGGNWALGFRPAWLLQRYGIGGAVRRSAHDNWIATKGIAGFLPRLFTGSGRKDVSSTVGIVDTSSQAVGLNFELFLQVLGLISLSLALLNLLPLLPLDGGHIVFSVIEKIRGRAVGRAAYERVSAVGFALFMILMFIGLSNDISRLSGG